MRVYTTGTGTCPASTQGLKFAHTKIDNAEKKTWNFSHFQALSKWILNWNLHQLTEKTQLAWRIFNQNRICFPPCKVISVSIFYHFSSKYFNLEKVMRNGYFPVKKEFFWHLETLWNPRLPLKWIWDHYIRVGFEIIPVSSSDQKLCINLCALIAIFDEVWRILKLNPCLNGCDLECFETLQYVIFHQEHNKIGLKSGFSAVCSQFSCKKSICYVSFEPVCAQKLLRIGLRVLILSESRWKGFHWYWLRQ